MCMCKLLHGYGNCSSDVFFALTRVISFINDSLLHTCTVLRLMLVGATGIIKYPSWQPSCVHLFGLTCDMSSHCAQLC